MSNANEHPHLAVTMAEGTTSTTRARPCRHEDSDGDASAFPLSTTATAAPPLAAAPPQPPSSSVPSSLPPPPQADSAGSAAPTLSQRSSAKARSGRSGRGGGGFESGKLAEGGGAMGAAMQFNTGYDDGSGVQVEPQQLLIACFVFIVLVMTAHIASKFIK